VREVRRIVVHHSAGKDTQALETKGIEDWHVGKGWRGIAYHYLIENVGGRPTAVLGRPLRFRGSHAKGANFDSVGVCVIGNFNTTEVTDETFAVLMSLLADLCTVFGLTEQAIVAHQQAGTTSTECPGDSLMRRWEELQDGVRDLL
jgi:N-acetylmuramoyl-L-alanine amidase